MNNSPHGRIQILTPSEIHSLLKRGFDALNAKRFDEAGACCQQVLAKAPKTIEAHFLVGLIATETKESRIAIQAFGSVTTLDPSHAAGWAHLARHFIKIGQPKRADNAIENAIKAGTKDPMVEDLIGSTSSLLGDQYKAKEWYSKAVKKAPKSPAFNINLASSLIFLGETEEAEAALDRALEIKPFEPQAHWRKSNLRRATDHTHLEVLKSLMERFASDPTALSFVAYAAGKEYEDLEEWAEAFRCFDIGAKAKKQVTEYDEAGEEEMYKARRETFSPAWAKRQMPGYETEAPIFIVGQPRTGTTLVERIITAHSMVHSAGELQQFRLAIRRNVKVEKAGMHSPELVRASGAVDPAKVGVTYMKTSSSMQGSLPRFVDKMPVNYLFIPLIIKALPNAKIIHLVRDPVDSCFSSFKQLFAEAYFHTYSLEEMARHYVRYHRLMAYWRELFPGNFLDVKYEEVVSDLESNARRMIDHLELPWQDTCLDFHRQDQAVTTASAVQVREKVHTRSVDRWRKYESQLGPVLEILRAEDIVA
ncbi:MAG: sulfotransferase family protein [Alphaproteobacteria bacterium]|nr:MAG: sulfotransferase family protein [Alphaproteobacteria bacterium]